MSYTRPLARAAAALPGTRPGMIGAAPYACAGEIMAHRFDIDHQHRAFALVVADDGALELWLDGCLRKRRAASDRQPLYVWTNIELDWEEHHYVEARYHSVRRELTVTVNGEPILQQRLPARG